jgi:hypothetical protein
LTVAGDEETLGQLEGDRPWSARARGWKTRCALGSRIALIYRIAFEDASGATIESRPIGIAIGLADARRRCLKRRAIEQLIRQLEPHIHAEVAVATAGWRRSVEAGAREFASVRGARQRAIVAQTATNRQHEYQPGLFDRRAELARGHATEESARIDEAAAHQLTVTRLADAITQRPPQLLLVLAP